MLNDQSIADALREAIQHLQQQNVERAEATLDDLGFERLLKPIGDRSKQRIFTDPADDFGVERVHQTGEHIRACRAALARGDESSALDEAEKAYARWMAS
ncbi:MAG: hypothetical protein ABSE57_24325 [Bryobacteraceae bacterium]